MVHDDDDGDDDDVCIDAHMYTFKISICKYTHGFRKWVSELFKGIYISLYTLKCVHVAM